MADTVVLGLDGATWDILDPLLKGGKLPELNSLISGGQSGTLESTFPPITAPAWLSMATGQNPGKTGVFYFLNRDDPHSFEFKPLGSDKFQNRSFWDILAAHDQSVGIFNYPMLYPPYEIDGFMISGLGSDADDTITYPKSLGEELDDVTDGYQVKVPYADPKYQDRPEKLESDLLDIIDKREAAMEYLLTEKDPDHFFGIISATDWAQHYFWRFHDEDHVLYDSDAGHEDALKRIWMRVDEVVGTVANLAEEDDANLLVVSDHGFGPVNKTFHSNEWLKQQGYLHHEEQSVTDLMRTKYFPYLRRIGESVVSIVPQLNDVAKSVGKSIRKPPGEGIDFERSVAFAPRQNLTSGMIYLLSDDPEDKENLIHNLESLVDRPNGPDTINIYEPNDIYHGENTDLAPDLMLEVDNFKCAVDPRPSTEPQLFSGNPPSQSRNGGHNQEGIIIATGSDLGGVEDFEACIYDIAPTLLNLHGVPIPEEVDGNILSELFDGNRETAIEREPMKNLVDKHLAEDRTDDEAVQQRLEDLGYI